MLLRNTFLPSSSETPILRTLLQLNYFNFCPGNVSHSSHLLAFLKVELVLILALSPKFKQVQTKPPDSDPVFLNINICNWKSWGSNRKRSLQPCRQASKPGEHHWKPQCQDTLEALLACLSLGFGSRQGAWGRGISGIQVGRLCLLLLCSLRLLLPNGKDSGEELETVKHTEFVDPFTSCESCSSTLPLCI